RPRTERHLRVRRHGAPLFADPHRPGFTALSLTWAGAEAGVALEALDVAEAVRDGVVDVVDAHVFAGADDRLHRAAALPAASPDATAPAPPAAATRPAAKSHGTAVRPSASTCTGKPFSAPTHFACAP